MVLKKLNQEFWKWYFKKLNWNFGNRILKNKFRILENFQIQKMVF